MLVERAEPGYRFRHALIRDALMQAMPPRVESTALREVAGPASRAVPYALRAADTAGALGAYRHGLNLIDAVRAHAGRRRTCPSCSPAAVTCCSHSATPTATEPYGGPRSLVV